MDDDVRVLRETLIREAAGLGVLLAVLWLIGPGRMRLEQARHRIGRILQPDDPYAGEIRSFAREVSRWDHEQAAQQDRRAGGSGTGCGCGLPSLGHR